MAERGMLGRLGVMRGGANSAAWRAAFDALPEAQALFDRDARLLAANPAWRRLAGPARPVRPGDTAASLFDPADAAALAGLLAEPAAPAAVPLRFIPVEGEANASLAARVTALPAGLRLLRLEPPATEGFAEQERLAAIGRLAGGIAHDFNNLLTVIVAGADHLLAAQPSPATAAELGQMRAAAERGAALVAQLLAFARQQRLTPQVLALNGAVAQLVPLLRRLLGGRVTVEARLEEPGRLVRVDPVQLDQVIINLAANARDAMPQGGRVSVETGHATVLKPLAIGGSTIPPGRWVTLTVADSGAGIPPELLPRIFEPFFTTRRERGGNGLGLATVQGILRQSGGEVTVQSTLGEGTSVRLWLPRHAGPAAPARAAAPSPQAPPESSPHLPATAARLLLVEDEAPLRRIAERSLTRAGHSVAAVEDAEAALVWLAAASAPLELLVTDVAMPGMDGLALARAVRRRHPRLPVLLISGYAEATLDQDLAAEGFGFLAKPYTPAGLLAAVENALQAE